MLKDVTLGQYFPGETSVHKLDPRTKLVLVIVYIVALFLAKGAASYALVAACLLAVIGIGMIREAFSKEEVANASFAFSAMLVLSIATSIDALAVGITFAILPDVHLWLAVGTIGLVTFLLSAVGVKVGSHFGARYRFTAQLCGGILLILLSLKILLEHLGVLSF